MIKNLLYISDIFSFPQTISPHPSCVRNTSKQASKQASKQVGAVLLTAITIGSLYSCSKTNDALPDAAVTKSSTKGPSPTDIAPLSARNAVKDPTGQFVDKSEQVTGYEDGRERPTRAKANHNHAPGDVHTSSLMQQDPDGGGGGGGIIYSNQSVGPYKFISSVGQSLNGGNENPGQYILDLEIAKGSSDSAGPEGGYTKLDADLNSGAGGKYIYLCFSRNFVSTRTDCHSWSKITPVSDVTATGWRTFSYSYNPGTSCTIKTPDGVIWPWNYKTPDLNDGSGGRYVFAYQSKDATPTPIREVGIVAGDNDQIQPPAGWVRVGDDLNMGAGGDYIYLCYKR